MNKKQRDKQFKAINANLEKILQSCGSLDVQRTCEQTEAEVEEMSDSRTEKNFGHIYENFRGTPESEAIANEVVGKFLGKVPLREPLSLQLPVPERIKIYAYEGFIGRGEGSEEDFEKFWKEALPLMEKGSAE